MAYMGSPNYAGIAPYLGRPGRDDYEQRDVDDPYSWDQGRTKFTPENVAKQFKQTQAGE